MQSNYAIQLCDLIKILRVEKLVKKELGNLIGF